MKHATFHANSGPFATVSETAKTFNVTERTIRAWIKTGILAAIKVGGVVRISRNSVQRIAEGAK
ncbi:MAG: helix-turn-helix domain-containing protein [Chthoniobacterales bacterium]|nr:helix-turn-helix domain-containing protein [Chthoniobacterales bacterium]